MNSMLQLLYGVGYWCFEDLRFQIPPEKERNMLKDRVTWLDM